MQRNISQDINSTATLLKDLELAPLEKQALSLKSQLDGERFRVAVVGEFSTGKSSLVNSLLGRDILPVATLPTTALPTFISHGEKEGISYYHQPGGSPIAIPFSDTAWNNLVAPRTSNRSIRGLARVAVNDPWLAANGIDIIDTPGAGDLSDERARTIEQCILGAEAMIMTTAANQPLSLTEREFILQKIASRDVPFVLLVITKLDTLQPDERQAAIDFTRRQRIKELGFEIPVVAVGRGINPADFSDPSIIGTEAVKHYIDSWIANPDRADLRGKWVNANLINTLTAAEGLLADRRATLAAKGEQRLQLIEQRQRALTAFTGSWTDMRNAINEDCRLTIKELRNELSIGGDNIVESFTLRISQSANIKDWVEKEYPIMLKRELAALSNRMSQLLTQRVVKDIRRINTDMSAQFKTMLRIDVDSLVPSMTVADTTIKGSKDIQNIKNARAKATIASSGLTISAALLLGATGAAPLILATVGVGAAANLLTGHIIDDKIERQRKQTIDWIAQKMPQIIEESAKGCEARVKLMYADIVKEIFATELAWVETQKKLIEQAIPDNTGAAVEKIDAQIARISQQISALGDR